MLSIYAFYMHACMCVCAGCSPYMHDTCMCVCMYMYIHIHIYMRTYMHTYIHAYIHIYIHAYIRMYDTHTHTHTHTYTHTHTQLHSSSHLHRSTRMTSHIGAASLIVRESVPLPAPISTNTHRRPSIPFASMCPTIDLVCVCVCVRARAMYVCMYVVCM